jgi:hypothetical protein
MVNRRGCPAVSEDGVEVKGVEILRPGIYVDAGGQRVEVTLADLEEMAAGYDPALSAAPVVVGHPRMDDPAYGWMGLLYLGKADDGGDVLLADLRDVEPSFADSAIRKRRYRNRSLSFWRRSSQGNPKPGTLYPKHLGLLGAHAPAVKGLKPIQMAAGDETVVIELGGPEWSWRLSQVVRTFAQVFGRLRDQAIAKDGVEAADRLVSTWDIEALQAAAAEIDAARRAEEAPAPIFASPNHAPNHEGGQMATQDDTAAREAALNEREAALAAREKALDERTVALAAAEAETHRKADAAFVDGLIREARLRPAERDQVLAELAAMDDGAATIELAAEGGEATRLTPRAAYRRRLSAAAPLVALGAHPDPGGPEKGGTVEFAAPAGVEVDPAGLDLHRKAVAYQAAHPGTHYMAAVKAVGGK